MPGGGSYCFVTTSGPCSVRYAAGVRRPSRAFISSAQARSSLPTTMLVREATVGPLSGTAAVSGWATSTASSGSERVSATICASVVRAPWPISVLPTRMRTPWGSSLSEAREASITSPEPVKPAPWK